MSSSQPFWHQGPVLLKTGFLWTRVVGGGWWFQDDSSALQLLCTLFLLLMHQLYLRSSGIRSWRLRTPGLNCSQGAPKECDQWRLVMCIQFSSVAQSCPTLCDPMNHSKPGLPVHHQLPEFTQTRWTWVWVNSGSWWWTERPGLLWFMGSQRVGHDWATELNWTELILYWCFSFWLTSLCIIGSSFIHLIRADSNASFLTAE